MESVNQVNSNGTSWSLKAGVFRGEEPKWAGFRNVAVLSSKGKGSLTLDTGYSLPGLSWCVMLAITVAILMGFAIFLKGHPASSFAADGIVGIFAIYMFMLWSRQQAMNLDLAAVSEVVVDERRCRIALLTQIKDRAGWIVLSEFKGRFPEALTAIQSVVGARCRSGAIAEGDWRPLIVVAIVAAACFVMVYWSRGTLSLY